MKSEIILDKKSKTYKANEKVSGLIKIENAPVGVRINNIYMKLEGQIKGQKKSKNLPGEAASQIPPIVFCKAEETFEKNGSFSDKSLEIPFAISILPFRDNFLIESYTGVYISIQYELSAVFMVNEEDVPKVTSPESTRVVVQVPSESNPSEKSKVPFVITPEGLDNPSGVENLPSFRIEGELDSQAWNLNQELTGWINVLESTKPIKSIDTQLVRVETISSAENSIHEATEVQNIQVADGGVRKNTKIPLYMAFPKSFTCPTTYFKNFRIEFELNVIVLFSDWLQVTKNFSLKLMR